MLRPALLAALVVLAGCDVPIPAGATQTTEPDLTGATVATGALTDDDATREAGQRRDVVATVEVPAGGTLDVELTSDAFDPYLLVEVVGTDQVLRNDDFNGSRSRSVIVQPNPTAGPLQARIVASAYAAVGRGAYTVRYAVHEPPPPIVGTPLAAGTVRGALGPDSPQHPITMSAAERPAQPYTVTLRAGVPATFHLESDAFDPYLLLERAGTVVARNDDFGGSRAVSQITVTPDATAEHTLFAGGFSASASGPYTLTFTEGAATQPTPTPGPEPAPLGDGGAQRVEGTLTDADSEVALTTAGDLRKADAFPVRLGAGQALDAELTSDAFDTYLLLLRDGQPVARNDDAGSTRRSALRYIAPSAGAYTLYVGTFTAAGRGAYVLSYDVR